MHHATGEAETAARAEALTEEVEDAGQPVLLDARAAGVQQRDGREDRQRAQRDDERGQVDPRHEDAVEEPGRHRHGDADQQGEQPVHPVVGGQRAP